MRSSRVAAVGQWCVQDGRKGSCSHVSTSDKLLKIFESALLGRKESLLLAGFSTQLNSLPRIVWEEVV